MADVRRANLPWGQAQTPITEILHQTVKKNGYKFPASVELEYPGSARL